MSRGPQRGSGKRTGLYAESKCTNRMRYDAFHIEIKTLPEKIAPSAMFALADDSVLEIFERPLHPEFIRPCSIDDVLGVLQKIPPEFLLGLSRLYLLGGSAKQIRMKYPSQLGAYDFFDQRIFLASWPRRDLVCYWKTLPPPHILIEQKKAGMQVVRVKDQWESRMDEESLRRYVLDSVLLHEIGHHIARREKKDSKTTENFADWIAQEISRKIG